MIGTSTILTIYIGGIESFKGKITTGNIAEFIIYQHVSVASSIYWMDYIISTKSAASQERINKFLMDNSKIENQNLTNTSIDGNIELKNVSFKYKENKYSSLKKHKYINKKRRENRFIWKNWMRKINNY